MHDFVLNCLIMTLIPLLVILLVIDKAFGMAVPEYAPCFLLVGTVDGLGMCDFFLVFSAVVAMVL